MQSDNDGEQFRKLSPYQIRMKNRTAKIILETLICALAGAIFGVALGFAF